VCLGCRYKIAHGILVSGNGIKEVSVHPSEMHPYMPQSHSKNNQSKHFIEQLVLFGPFLLGIPGRKVQAKTNSGLSPLTCPRLYQSSVAVTQKVESWLGKMTPFQIWLDLTRLDPPQGTWSCSSRLESVKLNDFFRLAGIPPHCTGILGTNESQSNSCMKWLTVFILRSHQVSESILGVRCFRIPPCGIKDFSYIFLHLMSA
jgi:hypothetical protein